MMNRFKTLNLLKQLLSNNADTNQEGAQRTGQWGGLGAQLQQGLRGRNFEMEQIQEEVATEQRGRIWLVGRCSADLQTLLEQLRQHPCPPAQGWTNPCQEGLFTLGTLPSTKETNPAAVAPDEAFSADHELVNDDKESETHWNEPSVSPTEVWSHWQVDELLHEASRADCVLYVWCSHDGWQPSDSQWCARLRNLGALLVPVALANTEPEVDWQQQMETVRLRLGIRPLVVSVQPTGTATTAHPIHLPADVTQLLEHLLALRPRLSIALAQEIPDFRPVILQRIVRQGALLTALLGAEPVPLIDLPLQVAVSWKMALQIAAVYGRPGLDYRSREMLGTMATNLLARAICQQVLKLAPFIGWALSAGVSGGSAWLLGHSLIRFYEEGKWVYLPVAQTWRSHLQSTWLSLRQKTMRFLRNISL